MIQLIITRSCNFRCPHCMFSCNEEMYHMPRRVFYKALEYISFAGGVNVIGGEPSLHPLFRYYLRTIAESADNVRLCTNGSWINRDPELLFIIFEASRYLGGKLLVRISNDKWHRPFISSKEIESVSDILKSMGVNVLSDPMDEGPVYPIGRALRGKAWDYLSKKGIPDEPAECTKGTKGGYFPWDNISIDVNGDVAPCSHHTTTCGNILSESIELILSKVEKHMEAVLRANPKNRDCHSCRSLAGWRLTSQGKSSLTRRN